MELLQQVQALVPALQEGLGKVQNLDALEAVRVDYLGRKGRLAQLMSRLPELDPKDRPLLGQAANTVKQSLTELCDARKQGMEQQKEAALLARFDFSLPGRSYWRGSLHPITWVLEEVCGVLQGMGYDVVVGPEVETDFHCFEALNFPPEHPARDMQDTLHIAEGIVLRTHTSPMQIRTMLERKPPVAAIAPGKVYRRDSDITHSPMFHQVEGLLVDKNVSLAHLRGTLTAFMRGVFGAQTKVRFRPSFFPFTEPSVEVDISCTHCSGTGTSQGQVCRVCKATGWVEILGSGMVHPSVFTSVGYDPEEVTGFAFGLGIERIAMLKYGVNDLRALFENDVRLLSQF